MIYTLVSTPLCKKSACGLVERESVPIPTNSFNAVYQLVHIYTHLFDGTALCEIGYLGAKRLGAVLGMWYDFPAIVRKADGSDRFTVSAYLEMNQCRYATAGILFKLHLSPCASARRDYRIGAPGVRPFSDEFEYFRRKK